MSVVVGVSALDAVLVAADCRVIHSSPGAAAVAGDNVLKVVPLGSHLVAGFVGNIEVAGELILALRRCHVHREGRLHEAVRWIPRYLKHVFHERGYHLRRECPVGFIIGGVIPGRCNQFRTQVVKDMILKGFRGETAIKRNSFPGYVMEILGCKDEFMGFRETGTNILCEIHSPDFSPKWYEPLQATAIGSGSPVSAMLEHYLDCVFFSHGGLGSDVSWVNDVVVRYIGASGNPTVGGLATIVRITKDGAFFHGFWTQNMSTGCEYSIGQVDNRIVLHNSEQGQILLHWPWETNALRAACPEFRLPEHFTAR